MDAKWWTNMGSGKVHPVLQGLVKYAKNAVRNVNGAEDLNVEGRP